MVLTPGSWLGSYEVLAHVGTGGMGEVYRARDARLRRTVALKVLREPLTPDPEGLDRFAREAQLLASLNHPHIAAVYAFEESSGVRAIVQEFVDGPTLSERLEQGPVPLGEALTIARQMADGLDAAHQRGIVHRDLKPGNVKLTAEGNVKLLDFGLAKAMSGEAPDAQSNSMTVAATQARTLLGTPAYMSPEQAVGAEVDRRTDIWAFGCVLFQMIAGRRPFDGPTVSSVLSSAIHDEPPWDALPLETPPAVHRLIRRCLQKDPRRRLRDIGDALSELDDDTLVPAPTAADTRSNYTRAAIAIGTGAAAGALAVWMLSPALQPPTPAPRTHAMLVLDHFAAPAPTVGHLFAIAPDAKHVVYLATTDKPPRLWVRALDDFTARALAGTEGAVSPFFSTDSRWVGFFADGQIKKVALAGGPPIPVIPFDGQVRGASFAPDGGIIIGGPKLLRVPAAGGAPDVIAESSDPRAEFRWPQALPDGRGALVTHVVSATDYDIAYVAFGNAAPRILMKRGSNPLLVDRYLLYAPQLTRDSNQRFRGLFAVAMDMNRVEPTGTPFPVIDDLHVRTGGAAEVGVAQNGTMIALPAILREDRLMWVDRRGATRMVFDQPGEFQQPRISPDGQFVAATVQGPRAGLYVHDLARGSHERVVTPSGEDYSPVWSHDGRLLASSSDGVGGITWRSLAPGAQSHSVAVGQHVHLSAWSPDGRFIVFEGETNDTDWDIRALDVHTHEVTTLVQTRRADLDAALSPDGRWLAYASNDSGRFEVYVLPFGSPGRPIKISPDGGTDPKWSREGSELFFLSAGSLFTSRVSFAPEFRAARPERLIAGQFQGDFDVAPGSREFLMVMVSTQDQSPGFMPLRLVLNWSNEINERAAGAGPTRSGR